MIDLGTLPGDLDSQAKGLNNRDQVVGTSSGGTSGFRAVLFMHGAVYDLNTLLAAPTSLVLEQATDINDWGAITGVARLGSYTRAVLLTPESPIF